MNAGIIGLPGVGKRTLFSLLTHTTGAPGGQVPRLGVLRIPDPRLEAVGQIQGSKKVTPATIEFVLVPGLMKGDTTEKLDIPALRNVDVLVHVVRAFEEPSVPHTEGSVDPSRDIELVELALTLADLSVVERRIERLDSDAKKGKKPDVEELDSLKHAGETLAAGRALRGVISPMEQKRLAGYALLTAKPCLLVLNVGEEYAASDAPRIPATDRWTAEPGLSSTRVSARIEAEIAQLPPEDARAFREAMRLEEPAAERIVKAAFALTHRLTFYTAEQKEARAWVVPQGTSAAAAAGTVHTDMERGFIRAEVVPFQTLAREGSWAACREKGLLRLEGKDYVVADGDVMYFRFHV